MPSILEKNFLWLRGRLKRNQKINEKSKLDKDQPG